MFAPELPADLRTYEQSPQRWRWKYIERLQGRAAHHARFFCSLDEASNRKVVAAHPNISAADRKTRLPHLGQLVKLMLQRLDARAKDSITGPYFEAQSAQLQAAREAAQAWSRIQLSLLLAYYGIGERELDLALVEEAFLMFASGELRVPVAGKRGHGEPDSAYYFAFAEFALLAAELGIDADLWEPQLPHLIWTQGVYVHMQRPLGPPPYRFHKYSPRGRERKFNPLVAAAARELVRGLRERKQLEAVHTQNCRTAFGE